MRLPSPEPRRGLPAVDAVLKEEALAAVLTSGRGLVVACVRQVLADWRQRLAAGDTAAPDAAAVARQALALARRRLRPKLTGVINATGVILHTNLGRAPLSEPACLAVQAAARRYTNLELSLATGKRGRRYDHVEELLCELTGAEAALVVNNNAAAVLLALNTLASGRATIVSRGQLVEIGGSFRVPEIMGMSGSRLLEVGTTNKTHPSDYSQAITPDAALLLKVHPSNYRVQGFTAEVSTPELVSLGRQHNLPVMVDLGSGLLIDLTPYGLPAEPTVQQELAAGADVVTVSGDKLLGGPQAGIILGRRELISRMGANPLTRALRIDKLTLAALQATLPSYRDGGRALAEIPALAMLTMPPAELKRRAQALRRRLAAHLGGRAELAVMAGVSEAGGGSLPLAELPTSLVAVRPVNLAAGELASRLRATDPPVLARVQDDRLLLDPRTLLPGDAEGLTQALAQALGMNGEA